MSKHNEKYRRLGLNISHHRKLNGLTQEQLAGIVHISRGHLSQIEAPNMVSSFSLATLFDIADALNVSLKQLFDFE